MTFASMADEDPTGWFEKLYAAAEDGAAQVPWDRGEPTAPLVDWAGRTGLAGAGRRALVVGCGLGRDAEFVARLGFATTAFDISDTAVRMARERHPGSPVDYRVADLLHPPAEWHRAFDLVVESNNVQALPRGLRARAVAGVGSLVAAAGTLLVLAAAATAGDDDEGPPWPLTRDEIEAFATGGLQPATLEEVPAEPGEPWSRKWRATFTRPA
ncbi:MAG TPA: methyltransferase domain-containing protein [Actinoplanes sp.]|nr:methyltransferase domain-containing protein [Actinoplanes sp.]